MGTVKYSGPVASFHCPTEATIRSLKVHFSPKQLGNGTPSPENIRPIEGWDGVIVHNDIEIIDIPPQYQRVEYIYNTGTTEWIDTDIVPYTNTKVQLKVMNLTLTGDVILGYYANNDKTDWRIFNYSQGFYFDAPNPNNNLGRRWIGPSWSWRENVIYEFEIGNFYAKNLDNNTYLFQNTSEEFTGTNTITLNSYGTVGSNKCSKNRWYYVKIYDGDTLVRNMYPCRRKSDDKPGMYDIVSGEFFTNQGTGEFICGPDVGETVEYEFGVLGKNKFDKSTVTDYYRINGSGELTAQSGMSVSDYIEVIPNQTYTITTTGDISGNKRHAYYDINKEYLGVFPSHSTVITIPENARYIRLTLYNDALDTTQLELGSTATAYEPYNPNKTVYGGWVDLVSGEVQQEWTEQLTLGEPYYYGGNVCFGYTYPSKYTLYPDNLPSERVLSALNKSKFSINTRNMFIFGYDDAFEKTDGNGNLNPEWTNWYNSLETKPTISLELYEPITYNLPPHSQELKTFLSQNNIWSNADYVEVEYDLHETQSILARKQFIVANQPHIVKPAAAPLQNFVTDLTAPLKECKVEFKPVQDLHGYDKPWIGGSGKNLFNINVVEQDPDNTALSNSSVRKFTTETYAKGASYSNYWQAGQIFECTVNNNSITVSASTGYGVGFPIKMTAETTYFISCTMTGNSSGQINIAPYDANGNYLGDAVLVNYVNRTYTAPANIDIGVIIFRNQTSKDNPISTTFSDIQIEEGSAATAYEPWENVCPISGWNGVEVWRTGKNLLSKNLVRQDWFIAAGNKATAPNKPSKFYRGTIVIPTIQNVSYEWKRTLYEVGFLDKNMETIKYYSGWNSGPVIPPTNAYYIYATRLINNVDPAIGDEIFDDEYLGYGTSIPTENDVKLYSGTIIPITFPSEAGTISGGYVDLVNGELVQTHYSLLVDGINVVANRGSYKANGYYGGAVVYLSPEGLSAKYKNGQPTNVWCDTLPLYIGVNTVPTTPHVYMPLAGAAYAVFYIINASENPEYEGDTSAIINYTNNWLKEHPTTIVYELKTPIHYSLTSIQLKTLRGTNNIWSNANGNIELSYWKH